MWRGDAAIGGAHVHKPLNTKKKKNPNTETTFATNINSLTHLISGAPYHNSLWTKTGIALS